MFKWFRKKNDDNENRSPDDEYIESVESEDYSAEDPETVVEPEVDQEPAGTYSAPEVDEPGGDQPEDVAAEDFSEDEAAGAEAGHAPDDGQDELTGDKAESSLETDEVVTEPKRKGFFARLFGEKAAEEEPSDEEADAADIDDLLKTVDIDDELTETPPTVDEDGETAGAEDLPVAEEPVVPEFLAEEKAEYRPEESVAGEAASEPETSTALEDIGAVKEAIAEEDVSSRKGIFAKFKEKLSATRDKLAGRIETLLSSVRTIDDDVLDELEELLITSDLGVKTTTDLLFKIRGQVASSELRDTEALKQALKKRISEMLDVPLKPMPKVAPLVIMVVGINGVGKTTTIAKLTKRLQGEGKKVLLAAGDTFRSAAVEQLTVWAERLGAEIVSQPTGSKSSAVVFDAVAAAQNRGSDVVIVDTAGRLHTKVNLMDELKKIKRVADKAMPGAPHHTILVLDGNTGQNALMQAQTFHEAVGVDSIIMTKLDGTAKGGVIVAIANELKIPITHIGLGESFDDLQPFDPEAFTEAILATN